MKVGWTEQSEAQQESVGLHVIQPNLPVLRFMKRLFAFPRFPRSSVRTRISLGSRDSVSQADKPVRIPTPERGNEMPPAPRFPRFCAAARAAAAITLMFCTACQPAFIGVDSEADVDAENCYAYRYGDKLRKVNFAQAFDWCHRSARLGNPDSQTLLGELYYLGLGGQKDIENASRWFEAAARQGHAHAQYMLYRIHAGNPNPEEQRQAAYWLQQARGSGYKLAL
jgi:hypothetical protein